MDLKELPAAVAARMMAAVDANVDQYISTDDFESLFETSLDKTIALFEVKIYTEKYPDVYQAILVSREVEEAIEYCKEVVQEARDDMAAYYNGGHMYSQMRERGLSQSDFV